MRRGKTVLFIFLLAQSVFGEAQFGVSRSCSVFNRPDPASTIACRVHRGDQAISVEKDDNGFYRVDIRGRCGGYLPDSCLELPAFRKIRRSEVQSDGPRFHSLQVGPLLDVDVVLIRPNPTGSIQVGWGVGGGLKLDVPITRHFRISPTAKYVNWTLPVSAQVASGSATATSFSENLSFAAVGGALSFLFVGGADATPEMEDYSATVFWVDFGFEYLLALSGTQTVPAGPIQITNPVSAGLASLLLGVDWSLDKDWAIGGRLGGTFNVLSPTSVLLFTGRGQVSLSHRF